MSSTAVITITETELKYISTPQGIRERAREILDICEEGVGHFIVQWARLPEVVNYVEAALRQRHPSLAVPPLSRWNHYRVGHTERLKAFEEKMTQMTSLERAKAKIDMIFVSVLLNAGVGDQWRYFDGASGQLLTRSEGVAVGVLDMFLKGKFSSDLHNPLQVDGAGVLHCTENMLKEGFQVTVGNPMIGINGRTQLLHGLGQVLEKTKMNGQKIQRPSVVADFLLQNNKKSIKASELLQFVFKVFSPLWPYTSAANQEHLGDVWSHPLVDLVPFHQLFQWIVLSLVEPLKELGVDVTQLDDLIPAADTRSGGLLVDLGLVELVDPRFKEDEHLISSQLIVEWRALTVALTQRIAEELRKKINVTLEQMPVSSVIEGGTWWAGRKIAAELRPNGGSPIKIKSDGTVI